MRDVGLANNGGSRTLILCCENLCRLGHDAFFHTGRSRYTWHKTSVKRIGGDAHPSCDVSIATGARSVPFTLQQRCRRAYYVRGLELWQMLEARLVRDFQAVGSGVFVNSEWLLQYMREHNVPAQLQYPGMDLDTFCAIPDTEYLRAGVGALRNTRHKTKRAVDIDEAQSLLGQNILQLNRHIKGPDPVSLNRWYNKFKVWFAPTELEGLHNPPIEACMAGCALVCTDHPRSGMSDYAVHGETALVYPARNIERAVEYIQQLLRDESLRQRLQQNMCRLLLEKFGTRRDRMSEFAQKLIALNE